MCKLNVFVKVYFKSIFVKVYFNNVCNFSYRCHLSSKLIIS